MPYKEYESGINLQYIRLWRLILRETMNDTNESMYFAFCRLYLSPQPTWQYLGSTCHVSTLNLHCILAGAGLIIWWERFRGTQKEDDRLPLRIQSSLNDTVDLI